MYESRARLAWAILCAAFALCALSLVFLPGHAMALVANASRPESPQLTVLRGLVTIERGDAADENLLAVGDAPLPARAIRPGLTIKTHDNAEAKLRFFDRSEIELRPNTKVEIVSAQQHIFLNGRDEIRLRQRDGAIRIQVAPAAVERRFVVSALDADLLLDEGRYLIPLRDGEGYVRSWEGGGLAIGAPASIRFGAFERVAFQRDHTIRGPLPPEVDLVRNGAFEPDADGRPIGWEWSNRDVEPLFPPGEFWTDVEPWAEGQPPARVVHLRRLAKANRHAETYLLQRINTEVRYFDEIEISVEFKLLEQSLPCCGYLNTEYPFELRLKYFNASGQEEIWRYGFYAVPPPDGSEVAGTQRVEWGRGTTFSQPLTGIGFPRARPDYIVDLQLVASGWDYESVVRRVEIKAR